MKRFQKSYDRINLPTAQTPSPMGHYRVKRSSFFILAIENGTAKDLKFAKDISGAPVTKQPNFGRPIAYQVPFYSRLGLRLSF